MSSVKKSKSYEISTLIELLKLKARDDFVQIKTTELGTKLGVSQQAASLHLKELEQRGLIVRKRSSGNRSVVKISSEGLDLISIVYSDLKGVLENELKERNELKFHGRVFRGLGQAAHYINLPGYRRQFAKLLNFVPFPGSLNIRLSSPLEIYQARQLRMNYEGLQLEGFTFNRKEYAPLKCFKAVIMESHPCAVLFTDRTHYNDSVLELVSPERLRDKLKLTEDQITGESSEKLIISVSIEDI